MHFTRVKQLCCFIDNRLRWVGVGIQGTSRLEAISVIQARKDADLDQCNYEKWLNVVGFMVQCEGKGAIFADMGYKIKNRNKDDFSLFWFFVRGNGRRLAL